MIKSITALALATAISAAPMPQKEKTPEWKDLGECRITTYCCACNDGSGHESSSGKYLEYGDCACSWLPIGTEISIEGEIFTVVDICGTDAIDIFIDTNECHCNLNEYKNVRIKTK